MQSSPVLFRSVWSPRTGILAWLVALTTMSCAGDEAAGPVKLGTLQLDRTSVELQRGDSTQLVVVARDARGVALEGLRSTWTSSDPSIAQVNASGVVTGVSAGNARVTVQVEGVTAAATIVVHSWNIADNVVVIDSTQLRLLSDSADRAAGRLRFTVLQGSAPSLPQGTIVVGAQGGGYLARVVSVSTSGATLTLETTPASLSEAIESGRFETSLALVFDPTAIRSVGPIGTQQMRGSEGRFTSLARGMRAVASGFVLSEVDLCELIKDNGGECPTALKTLKLKNGTLEFSPNLEVKAEFSGFSLASFRGVAKGSLLAGFDVLLEAEADVTLFSGSADLFTFTRPFLAYIGPVPVLGYAELSLEASFEAKATAKGMIEAGFTATRTVEVGAEWNNGWTPVFDTDGSFDPKLPSLGAGTLSGQVDIDLKLALKPELKIILYGIVGPFLNVEPYASATLTFGTSACGIKTGLGLNAEIGFTVPFLDPSVGTLSHKEDPWVTALERDWTCPLGALDVSTVTNGANPDADGYSIRVDSVSKGPIGSTAQRLISFVEVGERTIRLEDVASNCTVQGGGTRAINVATGGIHPVAFVIDCAALTGDIAVTTTTTGQQLDMDGYTLTLDGSSARAIATNGATTFAGIAPGAHVLELSGIAPGCSVSSVNPITVAVTAGTQTQAAFSIACSMSTIVVSTVTSGQPSSSGPWTVTLDGGTSQSIGTNDQVTYDVSAGSHTVELLGLPANCVVTGNNPATVSVAAGASQNFTFNVNCSTAALTVTVATTGDPAPAQSYTVSAGSQSQAVPVNGSVSFNGLPSGSTSVQLTGVPSHCTVQGLNPQNVDIPGSASFQVVCQTPLQCSLTSAPQPSLGADTVALRTNEGSHTLTLSRLNWGDLDLMATATNSSTSGSNGPDISFTAWSSDHLFLVPVDQSRIGEVVKVPVRIVGQIQTSFSGNSHVQGFFYTGAFDTPNDFFVSGNNTVPIDFTTSLTMKLGEWSGYFELVANASVLADNGSATARAQARIERIMAPTDKNGLPVPILQVCSASGAQYPM